MVLVVTEEALYFQLPVLFVGKMIQFCIFAIVMSFVKHVKTVLNGVSHLKRDTNYLLLENAIFDHGIIYICHQYGICK
jgi:hypothetical protein